MPFFKKKSFRQMTEKETWAKDHFLDKDLVLYEVQKQKLSNFGEELKLCSKEKDEYDEPLSLYKKYRHQHWYVTDGNWTIEFDCRNWELCKTSSYFFNIDV